MAYLFLFPSRYGLEMQSLHALLNPQTLWVFRAGILGNSLVMQGGGSLDQPHLWFLLQACFLVEVIMVQAIRFGTCLDPGAFKAGPMPTDSVQGFPKLLRVGHAQSW